ncbi:NUDIX domain-containing protein [Thioalkalivibrio paradoxus]|uniref:NUDIX hydrolase n=1 Tax=Thioalkalivibrio paradoxus ARh 1 TaxID=713585 RepID=W0DKZ5_9GAMM|nr:NUDIX hydrolase [Thioalkalivibrio paradoxus ARh 1]
MNVQRPRTPLLAVDLIIRQPAHPGRVLLIERRNPPFGWALPGGFVDEGETVEQAARREAREETALEVRLECLLGLYSDPERDPRGHTVSAVYVARGEGDACAQDDARALQWRDPEDREFALAFDHRRILDDYLRHRATGEVAPIRQLFR